MATFAELEPAKKAALQNALTVMCEAIATTREALVAMDNAANYWDAVASPIVATLDAGEVIPQVSDKFPGNVAVTHEEAEAMETAFDTLLADWYTDTVTQLHAKFVGYSRLRG